MIIMPARPADFAWLKERSGAWLSEKVRGIAAVDDRGTRGVVAYDLWTPNSCHMHVAIAAPSVARRLIGPALEYPFQQLDLGVVVAALPDVDGPVCPLQSRLGFRQAGCLVDGWEKGTNLVLYTLSRADWLAWRSTHGNRIQRHQGA